MSGPLPRTNMPEQPCLIGGVTTALVGVVTQAPRATDTVALIVPAPGQGRTGTHRLHVRLARDLAAAGVPSLRYDAADGGDSPPGAAPAARYDGDLIAATEHLRALYPDATIALVAFRGAAIPVVRAMQVLLGTSPPLKSLFLIDPALDDLRPLEPNTWLRRVSGRRPQYAAPSLDDASLVEDKAEAAWLDLPKQLRRHRINLHVAVGHDRYARELVRNHVAEDAAWNRALRDGERVLDVERMNAAWSDEEAWRTMTGWVVGGVTRLGG